MVICLERGADLHTAQVMPLPLTVSCFSKIQISFTFLVLADLGSPGQRAVKRMYVCKLLWLLIHLFNGLFARTTWVSQYQKDKNQSGFKWEKRWWGLEMQWHQLDHMQTVRTSLQIDNHTNTSPLNFYRSVALPDSRPNVQSTLMRYEYTTAKWCSSE